MVASTATRAAPWALLLCVLLSGCSGGGTPPSGPAPTGEEASGTADTTPANGTQAPLPMPPAALDFSDCQMHAHNVPLTRDEVAPLLPEGFTALPYATEDQTTANAVLLVAECGAMSNGTLAAESVQESVLYLTVNPPDSLADGDVDAYRLAVAHVSGSPELIAAYATYGLAVGEADVALDRTSADAVEASEDSVDGDYDLVTRSQVARSGTSPSTALRYFYARDGELLGAVDRVLSPSVQVFVGPVTYELSGAPWSDRSGAGYTVHYDFSGVEAFRIVPVDLPQG